VWLLEADVSPIIRRYKACFVVKILLGVICMIEKIVDFFIHVLFAGSIISKNKSKIDTSEHCGIHYTLASVFPSEYSFEEIQEFFKREPANW